MNLGNKMAEETRNLREDFKAVRADIKDLKPSFVDVTKKRETPIL